MNEIARNSNDKLSKNALNNQKQSHMPSQSDKKKPKKNK